MQFYCPNCQNLVEAQPEATVTTKFNQTAYKAHCPVCQQDLAALAAATQPPMPAPALTADNAV